MNAPHRDLRPPYEIRRRGNDVIIEHRGHITLADANSSIAELHAVIGDDTVRLIIVLSDVTGYEKEARVRMGQIVRPLRHQITRIYFVGANLSPIVRMGASAVALANFVLMKFVDSIDDVPTESP